MCERDAENECLYRDKFALSLVYLNMYATKLALIDPGTDTHIK